MKTNLHEKAGKKPFTIISLLLVCSLFFLCSQENLLDDLNPDIDEVVNNEKITFTFEIKDAASIDPFNGNCTFAGGAIYMTGGSNPYEVNKHYMYDITNDTWSSKTNLPASRLDAMTASHDNLIYFMGGHYAGKRSEVWRYNPALNTWSSRASLPQGTSSAASITHNGYIYIFGGSVSPSPYTSTANAYKYNISTNTWAAIPGLPVSDIEKVQLYTAQTATVIHNNSIILIGLKISEAGKYNYAVVEYNPVTDTYIQDSYPPLPIPISNVGAFVFNNEIFVVGGRNEYSSTDQKTILRLSSVSNTWVVAGELPIQSWHGMYSHCILDNNTMYLFVYSIEGVPTKKVIIGKIESM